MRSREHLTRCYRSWKARAWAFCSSAGACAVVPLLTPLATGDKQWGSTGSLWAEHPCVCSRGPAVGEAPPKLPFPPMVQHPAWTRDSPWPPRLLTGEGGTPFSSENYCFNFVGSGSLPISLFIYAITALALHQHLPSCRCSPATVNCCLC